MSAYNVRSAALDLAIVRSHPVRSRNPHADAPPPQAFSETLGETAYAALQGAFEQLAQDADRRKAAGDEDWWKGYDSALAVVGSVSEDLIEHVEECRDEGERPQFGLESVFEGVIMTNLTATSESIAKTNRSWAHS